MDLGVSAPPLQKLPRSVYYASAYIYNIIIIPIGYCIISRVVAKIRHLRTTHPLFIIYTYALDYQSYTYIHERVRVRVRYLLLGREMLIIKYNKRTKCRGDGIYMLLCVVASVCACVCTVVMGVNVYYKNV